MNFVSRDAFHIAIFCKAPVAGSVKTRLIPAFGAEGAKNIYVQLVERTLATVRDTCHDQNASASLWVADDVANESLQQWSNEFNFPTHLQVGADLGARMLHCLQTMHGEHERATDDRKPVLLIGTDCPAFTREHLLRAAKALTAACAWVFTPSEDGGYVLVGSNAPRAEPFTEIAWSTSDVMMQTRAALAAMHLKWAEMDTLWDVDVAPDVLRAERNNFLLKTSLKMS